MTRAEHDFFLSFTTDWKHYTCDPDQRLYAVVMMSSAVAATVHEFVGRRGGESRGVNHGYGNRSAVVFDSSTLLLGREDKKKRVRTHRCLSLRGKYGPSVSPHRTRGKNVVRFGAALLVLFTTEHCRSTGLGVKLDEKCKKTIQF